MAEPTPKPSVESASRDGKIYVQNPLTKETQLLDADHAARNVFTGGWVPVSERDAEALRGHERLVESVGRGEAVGLGIKRGLTLGLSDLAASTPAEKELLQAQGEAHPVLSTGAEIATTLAPIILSGGSGLLARGASALPASIAFRVGEGATALARGAEAGLVRTAGARALGAGVEGAAYGGAQAIRDAHLEDTPLTAQKLLSGMAGGFGLGAVLGAPFGVAEGLGNAATSLLRRRGAAAQGNLDEILRPGLSDADQLAIARAHGMAGSDSEIKGAIRDFQHANLDAPNVSRELFDLVNAPGELGRKVRAELFTEGEQLRDRVVGELAGHLDKVHQMDQVALGGWSGRFKKEQIKNWVPESEFTDDAIDAVALLQRLPVEERVQVANRVTDQLLADVGLHPREWGELLTALGAKDADAINMIGAGIANGDRRVAAALFGSKLGNNETMRGLIRDVGLLPKWRQEALELVDNAGQAYEQAVMNPKGVIGEGGQGKLKEVLALLAEERKAIATGSRADAAASLDYIKKRLGSYAGEGYLGIGDATEALARGWHEPFRKALERPDLWGDKFATLQRDMNAILHKRIARDPAFHGALFDSSLAPDPRNPWAIGERASPQKVAAAVGKFGTDEFELNALRTHLKESKEVADLIRANYDLKPQDVSALAGIDEAVAGADRSLTESLHYARRVQQGAALRKIGIAGAGWRERALVGYVIGGAPGAVAGAAVNHLMNPGHGLALRAALERAWGMHGARVSEALSKMMAAGAQGARASGRAAGPTAAALQITGARLEDKNKGYQATFQDLTEMANNRDKVLRAIGANLGHGLEIVPTAPSHMADAVQRAAANLMMLAPAKPMPSLFGTSFRVVSDSEIQNFERLVDAALDPASILEAAADGTLTPDMVLLAEQTAPELVADMRGEVVNFVASAGPDAVPYQSKVQLSVLFNVPLDMTMMPEYVQGQQIAHQARAQMQQSSGPTPSERRTFGEDGLHSKSRMSQGDRIESNEVIR